MRRGGTIPALIIFLLVLLGEYQAFLIFSKQQASYGPLASVRPDNVDVESIDSSQLFPHQKNDQTIINDSKHPLHKDNDDKVRRITRYVGILTRWCKNIRSYSVIRGAICCSQDLVEIFHQSNKVGYILVRNHFNNRIVEDF